MRRSGILMHISSLPGPGGIGSLGKEAYAFADFLKASGMAVWQVLPLGPTGYGESPYQSSSVFAGNPMLISCAALREAGLVAYDDGEEFTPDDPERVNYPAVRENKEKLLRRCFAQSEGKLQKELAAFRRENPWVEDFALFTALKARYGGAMWTKWPDREVRRRQPAALERCRRELDGEIRYHLFCQYLFFRQWFALKRYCNGLGIRLFGDMPIYVAADSAEMWLHGKELFLLDGEGNPAAVAGVPPDAFSDSGQLWGNPVYDWEKMKADGYGWWRRRIARALELYDIVRIDHFRGFDEYFCVPAGAPDARSGVWRPGPGMALFRALRKALGDRPVIAEDLGYLTDSVRKLVADCGFPGMKVLEFAFDSRDSSGANDYLPHNYPVNCVVYTGTHDNETAAGWYESILPQERAAVCRYLHRAPGAIEPLARDLVCTAMASVGRWCVIPLQDWLGLDNRARINHPSTLGGNWRWRVTANALTPALAAEIRAVTAAYGRLPEAAVSGTSGA